MFDGQPHSGEDKIEGRNAIQEALRASRPLDRLFVAEGIRDKRLAAIVARAREHGAVIVTVPPSKLDAMSETHAHQGVIAIAAARSYASLSDILAVAKERNEPPFIVACDGVEDVGNLGAIIRTAEAAGAHGIVIPKRRSASLTAAADKASAGALEHIAVARVPNLPSALRELKENGLWVYGADMDGKTELHGAELSGPVCLVVGSEGEGLGRLVRESCDGLIRIPMRGTVSSLNASVAAALLIYEALRNRASNRP